MLADFVVYDRDSRVGAVIEAKRRFGTSAAWATELRKNALTHGELTTAVRFVLLTPDKLYSWQPSQGPDDPPSCELEMASLFEPYFARVGTSPKSIEPGAFELLVSWWLEDLATSPTPESARLLQDTGLPLVIDGARVVRQAAA